MLLPFLSLWMKHRYSVLGDWIWNSLSAGFEAITRGAGQAEIAVYRFSACGTGNDMLNLKNRNSESLRGPAVCTTIGKQCPDAAP
jgi:hypothetical protein